VADGITFAIMDIGIEVSPARCNSSDHPRSVIFNHHHLYPLTGKGAVLSIKKGSGLYWVIIKILGYKK
jgi:hypothetical protein